MNSQTVNPRLEVPQDLGFGTVVTEQKHFRLLNRDGSFNVRRTRSRFPRLSYHTLLTMSWTRFAALSIAVYAVVNCVFAFAYMALRPRGASGCAERWKVPASVLLQRGNVFHDRIWQHRAGWSLAQLPGGCGVTRLPWHFSGLAPDWYSPVSRARSPPSDTARKQ